MTAAPGSTMEPPPRIAARSSFYAGMRILPREQRDAMYAVYQFCREVDDIADGEGAREARFAALSHWRSAIDALYAGATSERTAALAGPVQRFGLAQADFMAVIDGMAMDVERDIAAPDRATFDLYCDRVAVAVGRLSCPIFGLPHEAGLTLSHHLGRALQITNILRDIDEDLAIGRLYLPRESLAAAGIMDSDPVAILAHPALDAVCHGLAAEAQDHFVRARAIMDRCPRSAVKAPRLMAAAYGSVLARLRAAGWRPPRKRVRVDKLRLLLAVLRHGLF